ncbi:T9SS type A sorting domain-containing protein [Subsaxibacter sp. CAU 1640]|uniref:M1 family aminopeptidase n=1 Tax=Subsaxibacter sp. CAU 1640 TaxID=2933271 RepID=UPI002004623F|nr:M1 family aminopeptidase [Subsaxibacter sp. CAU 1640]MCK7589627.1 T9SS type A sorting domain-containing protein [Subsaxibacter sp. CAU 1640]
MRLFLRSLIILVSYCSFGQTLDPSFNSIREAEAKAALNRMQFRANPNTGNYDVKYHRLEFNVDPTQAQINGDVTTYFEAKSPMNEITFDLANNMIVSQVLQRGNPLAYTQNANDELVITLPATQNAGVLDSLTVSYSGNPVSSGFGSFEVNTHSGKPVLWTLSEPYGAKGWWPCKQDLIDKIEEIDVYITSPQFNPDGDEYVSVSNGLEQGQVINGSNKTTHFHHQYPIPAYLIAIAVTNYSVYSHNVPNNGNPFEIVNYVYPENLANAQNSTPVTVDIMNLFSNLFQEYPFSDEKYGHAQFGWGGGMEHTTVSFMGGFGRGLIAHELAHQWFGDKVTCGSWKDIWLNEGFATYLSGLTVENLDGNDDFRSWKQQTVNYITSQPDGAVYLSDTDTLSVGRIFSGRLSYDKGAMVLHMLRKKLGDTDFYQGLQNYLNDPDHAYGYAKTADLMNILQATSGTDLTEFFNDWIYNQGYPTYSIQWHQPTAAEFAVRISQTQSHPSVSFFEAPVPLRLIGTQGEVIDMVFDNTVNQELFTRTVNFTVANVIFDPESDLISRDNSVELNVNEQSLELPFKIFPNPASQTLYIQKPEGMVISEVRIYNTLGQLLSQSSFTPVMDVSHLSTGLLMLQFETNTGTITKSLLKN